MKRGIGSYDSYGTGKEKQGVRVEGQFENKRRDGTAIQIWDGTETNNPVIPGQKIKVMHWITVKHIEDSNFDSIHDLHRGQKIEIWIPEWLATEKGLI